MRTDTVIGRVAAAAAAGISLLGLAACGSGSGSAGSGTTQVAPTVLAAASLSKVFPKIDPAPDYSFGGSGALAVQIAQGAPADVFAAASAKQPAALLAKGLIEPPVKFATNRLVLIVPADNPAHITSIADVTRPGVKLVVCAASVPCGDYARNVFTNLGISSAAMANVVSNTTDVTQAVAQVTLGQADAGIVYVTDARAAGTKVHTIVLPAAAKPGTSDDIAIVTAGAHRSSAQAFVDEVMSARGQAILRAAGFGAP
jgi:molybdate transport system substrate-binding protein